MRFRGRNGRRAIGVRREAKRRGAAVREANGLSFGSSDCGNGSEQHQTGERSGSKRLHGGITLLIVGAPTRDQGGPV